MGSCFDLSLSVIDMPYILLDTFSSKATGQIENGFLDDPPVSRETQIVQMVPVQ